jgi:hydrogenase nickel incorporation protein HypA/HybF
MHELSIALRIVKSLNEELANEGDLTVSVVTIQVGALTGLVPEALQFSWDMATDSSRLQGSKLNLEWVDAAGFCPECQVDRTLTNLQSFRCPTCRTPIQQITGGNELEILTMEIHDNDRH